MADTDVAGIGDILAGKNPDKINAIGLQALMTGKVHPDEIGQAQNLMSHPAFSMAQDPNAPPPSPLSMQSAPVAPVQRKQNKTANTQKNTTNKTTFSSPEEYAARMQGPESLPEVQDERAAIQLQQDRINKMQAMQDPNDNGAWIRALAAYADSTQGSHLSGTAKELAPTNQERMGGVAQAQDALTKRKNDLAKLIFEGGKQLRDGSTQNQLDSLRQLIQGDPMGMNANANARLAALPARAGKDFDTQTANATKSVESFNRGEQLLNNSNIPLTEQNLNMIQQDISNGIAASGAATDSKIAMDLQQTWAGAIQKFETKMRDLKPGDDLRTKVPGLVNQLNSVLKEVRDNYRDNINRQSDQIETTYKGSYPLVPGLQETVEAKKAALASRFPKSANYSKTGEYKASPAVTRTKALKDMSQAELDAYEASLHKGG